MGFLIVPLIGICYILIMKVSTIITKDYEALIKLCKKMKPQERLVAFYNHSRLLNQVQEAGRKFRAKTSQPSLKNKS